MSGPLLQAQALSRTFGAFTAVDQVTFDVAPGEVVGLLGANGAGKTTVIRMLLGLLRPTAGTRAAERQPPSRAGRERLGYVPQGLGLYAELTVRENLEFAAQAFGCPPARPEGPMRETRTGWCRICPWAFAGRSPFCVPAAPAGRAGARRAELWCGAAGQGAAVGPDPRQSQRGVGVLVTTHYMQEAQQCDRLLLMSQGRLVAQGTEADIVDGTTAVAVASDDWARVFAVLSAAGWP